MTVSPFHGLTCPLDGHPLFSEGNTWRCAQGHSFDQAREGYLYLLPVQNKRSLDPGDSKLMVAARRRFLGAGYYQPIADAVTQACLHAASSTRLRCLDAGCGEGYYLRHLAAQANVVAQDLLILGVDISKWAVQSAAKQDKSKHCAWIVGTNARIPAPSAAFDRILCLFGFPVYPEFARLLGEGGRIVQVDAGPAHLKELREVIYPSLKPERTAEPSIPEGFVQTALSPLRYSIALDQPDLIADLLAMTPHLYRATAEGRRRAAELTQLSVTVDVRIQCLERRF